MGNPLESRAPRRPVVRVAWQDFVVDVETGAIDAVGEELRARLSPFFEVSDGDPCEDFEPRVVVACGRGPVAPPPVRGAEVTLRRSAELPAYNRTAVVSRDSDQIRVFDAEGGVDMRFVEGSRRCRVTGEDDRAVAKQCRRLVQDLVRLHVWATGGAIIESAAVSWGGDALALAGPSRAGKTTLAARLLAEDSALMIANDELMLTTGPVAHGSPVHVMVRRELGELHPALADVADELRRSGAPKRSVHYVDFAARLGSSIVVAAPLRVLAILADGRGVTEVAPPDIADLLEPAILWDGDWETPWRSLDSRFKEAPARSAVTLAGLLKGSAVVLMGRDTISTEIRAEFDARS